MTNDKKPLVAVLMGSDSDLPTMSETAKMLEQVRGAARDAHLVGAPGAEDDAPARRGARGRGDQVFVVGAGLAAHLAGAIASVTTLPVIGVPMGGGSLQGVDALYSTVQMPGGRSGRDDGDRQARREERGDPGGTDPRARGRSDSRDTAARASGRSSSARSKRRTAKLTAELSRRADAVRN